MWLYIAQISIALLCDKWKPSFFNFIPFAQIVTMAEYFNATACEQYNIIDPTVLYMWTIQYYRPTRTFNIVVCLLDKTLFLIVKLFMKNKRSCLQGFLCIDII